MGGARAGAALELHVLYMYFATAAYIAAHVNLNGMKVDDTRGG